jgi:hypothetical protein
MTTPTTVQFTDDEKKAMQSAALAVWDECAYDILQATAEEEGKDINSVTVSRDAAIEIALDSGRMEDLLRRSPGVITEDLLKRIQAADYKTLIAAVRPAFGFGRYGF